MPNKLLVLVAALLLVQFSMAGTVTLTGTCPSAVAVNKTSIFTFTMSNSGNDSALNLALTPSFTGFSSRNSTETIQFLGPGSSKTLDFYVYNFSHNGSYAEYFSAQYAQGSSQFNAVFPCLVDVGAPVQSQVMIKGVSNSGDTLTVSLQNIGASTLQNVSVSGILPQGFSVSPESQATTLLPGENSTMEFSLSKPQLSGASYTAAVSASYTLSGVHYSSLSTFVLNFYPSTQSPSGLAPQPLSPFTITGIIIVIIIILIIVSIIKNLREKRSLI